MAYFIDGLLILGVILLALCTAAALLGRFWWLFELTTHFRAQYAALLLLGAVGLLVNHQLIWAAAAGIIGAVNVFAILPAYGRVVIPGSRVFGHPLRAALININFRNTAYERALQAIRGLDADFVCIIEVNRAWKKQLLTLRDEFPFMQGIAFRSGWGMWLMSRRPLGRSEIVSHKTQGIPCIIADLTVGNKPVTVIMAHPYAPVSRRYSALRNKQLSALARVAASQRNPVLVFGDFNCTPWSPYFHELLRSAGLRDSRQGFGLQPTWPSWNVFLRIPIDHCFVSSGVAIRDRRVGGDVGSDHFPVVVDFSLI